MTALKSEYKFGLLLLILYVWISYPSRIGEQLIGFFPDTYVSVWSLWHFYVEPDSYTTTIVFAPQGSSLLLHNLTELVSLPFSYLFIFLGPIAIYNSLVAVVLVLNYLAGLALVGNVAKSPFVIAFGALLLTLHPFILGHIGGGHANLFTLFPLYLLLSAALAKEVSILAIASWMTAVLLTDYYQLWIASLSLLFIFIYTRNRRVLIGLCCGVAIACIKLVPAIALLLNGDFSPNHDPALHSLPASAVFVPHPLQLIGGTSKYALNWAETGAYFGLAATILALISCAKRRSQFLIGGLVFLLLAYGPFGIFAPYKLLALTHVAPPVPARFFLGALIFLALSSAIAFEQLKNRWLKLILAATLAVEFFPKTLPVIPAPKFPKLIHLESATVMALNSAHPAPLLDLSSPEIAMIHQTLHGLPIVNGFLARRPQAAENRNRHLRRSVERFCANPTAESYDKMASVLRNGGVGGLVIAYSGEGISPECSTQLQQINQAKQQTLLKDTSTAD
jgi:hypothetical protein